MTVHTKILYGLPVSTVECFYCGNDFIPGDRFQNEFTRSDGGEKISIFICDHCKKKGRHEIEWLWLLEH